jgi:hypothetical protein
VICVEWDADGMAGVRFVASPVNPAQHLLLKFGHYPQVLRAM